MPPLIDRQKVSGGLKGPDRAISTVNAGAIGFLPAIETGTVSEF